MPSAITFLGFPDPVSEDYTIISSLASVPADLPLSNLKSDEPSERTRLLSLDPLTSQIAFDFAGIEKNIDGFALIDHNITPGNSYRFIGLSTSGGTGWTFETTAPNAIVANSNSTGTAGNIDEAISSPDGLKISPTNPAISYWFRLGFPALTHTPHTGSERGFFVVRAKLEATGNGLDNLLTLPRIFASLTQAGLAGLQSLGYRAVQTTTTGGQIFIFPFAFSQLVDPTGADIEFRLDMTKGSATPDPLPESVYATIESVRLYYERATPVASGYSADLDTGWIEVPGELSEDIPTVSNHHLLDVRWQFVQTLLLLVRSDQSHHEAPYNLSTGAVPYLALESPGDFIQLGIVETGEMRTLTYGLTDAGGGPLAGPYTSAVGETGLTGNSYTADLFSGRRTDPLTLIITKDERNWLQLELGWKRGLAVPFYVALEPGESEENQIFTGFWAMLAADLGMPKRLGTTGGEGETVYEMTMELKEKL